MSSVYIHGTPYTIAQVEGGYHHNSDSELLGKFIRIKKKDTVLDIGCNDGVLLYYASLFEPASLTGIDIQPKSIAVAKENAAYNNVSMNLLVQDVRTFEGSYSYILSNPPYFSTANQELKNENEVIKTSRHTDTLSLQELFSSVHRLLKDNGRFAMVHRASHLSECLFEASRIGLVPVRMRLAYTTVHGRAKSVLIEFKYAKHAEVNIEPPAYLDDRTTF